MSKRETRDRGGTSICFDCQNACGGCSWSEIDPETKKPAFKPVEGWTALRVPFIIGYSMGWTYYVTKCPQFIPDEPPKQRADRTKICPLCGSKFMPPLVGRRVYCKDCVPEGFTYGKNLKKVVPSVKRYKTKEENA